MSIFDSWSRFIADIIEKESELSGTILNHSGEIGSAREAIIKGVLHRIVPDIYEIGTGEIVDHLGTHSKQIDIVIARKDFPNLALPSGSKVYLVESVLATIEIKSELNKSTLIDALENCASVAELKPNVISGRLDELAREKGLRKTAPSSYTHDNPLETARFDLFGRPVSYIFSFKGYKSNVDQFAQAISDWTSERERAGKKTAMRHHPAVISAEGCFSWRNAAPYLVEYNIISRVGIDSNPLRIFVLHLLFTLKNKVIHLPDSNGLVPNLDAYLQQMAPFTTQLAVGTAVNLSG